MNYVYDVALSSESSHTITVRNFRQTHVNTNW